VRRLDGDGENHKISTAEQHIMRQPPETIESQMLEATTRNQRKIIKRTQSLRQEAVFLHSENVGCLSKQ
jgi:hypothetical protein